MDLLTPAITGALLVLFTAILAWISKGQFDAMARRFDAVDRRFDAVNRRFDAVDRRFDALERRFDTHEQSNERRFEQLLAEIAQLRSDLLQVVLADRPHTRPQTG